MLKSIKTENQINNKLKKNFYDYCIHLLIKYSVDYNFVKKWVAVLEMKRLRNKLGKQPKHQNLNPNQ